MARTQAGTLPGTGPGDRGAVDERDYEGQAPGLNPYVGPRSFDEEHSRFFFGRDEERRQLTSLIIAHRVVLFYAQSGAGKTSLLRASVIPELKRRKKVVVLPITRVGGDLPPGVAGDQVVNIYAFNALLNLAGAGAEPGVLAGLSLREGLAPYLEPEAGERRPRPRLLILDQFEELFTGHPQRAAERAGFFRQLAECLAAYPQLSLLLSMREDHIARLDFYAAQMPNRLRTRFRMERLPVAGALEAVQKPAERAGRPFEPGVGEGLVDNLRRIQVGAAREGIEEQTALGEYVEPVHLQIVCWQLWENLPPGGGTIRAEHVQAFGDVDQALSEFYEGTLQRVAEQTGICGRQVRAWFDQALITPAQTRGLVYRDQEGTGGLPNEAVDILNEAYIIRAVIRGRVTWYELAHDRLVEPILASNQAWQETHLSPLQRQAELWEEQGRPAGLLLRDQALVDAEGWAAANEAELTEVERAFLRECREAQATAERERRQSRRIKQLAVVALAFSVLALAAFAWSFFLRAEARDLRSQAEIAAHDAVVARDMAIELEAEGQRLKAWGENLAERANRESENARRQTRISLAQVLASTAPELATDRLGQHELASLLAAEAVKINPEEGRSIHWLLDRSLREVLGNQLVTILPGSDWFLDVAVSPDGRWIFAASGDGGIYRWELNDLDAQPAKLEGHKGPVTSIALSPDGTLASTSTDGTVGFWDANTGVQLGSIEGHSDRVNSVAFSPDGRLATASSDNTAMMWDLERGLPASTLVGHEDAVLAVTFGPDGRLATAGADGRMIIWDFELGAPATFFQGDEFFTSAAFSVDGRLATGGSDQAVKLWDISTGEVVDSLECHQAPVRSIAFSPSGEALASAGDDGVVCIWDLTAPAAPPATFLGHEDRTYAVAFTPDGTTLVSASRDATVRLWIVDINVMADMACGQAGRNMTESEWYLYLPTEDYQPTCPDYPTPGE